MNYNSQFVHLSIVCLCASYWRHFEKKSGKIAISFNTQTMHENIPVEGLLRTIYCFFLIFLKTSNKMKLLPTQNNLLFFSHIFKNFQQNEAFSDYPTFFFSKICKFPLKLRNSSY